MAGARSWFAIAAILALSVLAGACGGAGNGGGAPATTPPPASSPNPQVTPSSALAVVSPSPSPETSSNAELQLAVDAASRDAATRLGLAGGAGDVHVEQAEARQWPDSSLGCPSDESMYSQIVTPGYLVVVSAAGKQLEYHSDARGRVVLCKEF